MVKTGRFFIIGSQRGGTTLMRLVLECHPRIRCFDETRSYAALASGNYEVPCDGSLVGFKIPRWTEQLKSEIAKDPDQTEQAYQFYRQDPALFVLRDVRDNVVSMQQLKMGRDNWINLAAKPILAGKLAQPEFLERFGKYAEKAKKIGSAAALGALYWRYKTQAFFDYAELGWPVLPVHYERLVTSPEPVLRRTIDFLGLEWDPALLKHQSQKHTEIFENGLAMGNTNPERAIDARSVGQWKRELSAADLAAIQDIAGDLNDRVQSIT